MKPEAFQKMLDLNLVGSVLPLQIFGEAMADAKQGSIINISSMASQRVLTRVIGYSAAKAGIDNFTRWLAVDLAQKYGDRSPNMANGTIQVTEPLYDYMLAVSLHEPKLLEKLREETAALVDISLVPIGDGIMVARKR